MCGRYTVYDDTENDNLQRILTLLNAKYPLEPVKTGEIFPTNAAPVLYRRGGEVLPEKMIWGFPNFKNKGVIINARSETAAEKRMFQKPLKEGRCVVPSTGFFEWSQDSRKQKYLFRHSGTDALYMAGLYQACREELRFVILTTGANAAMREIHSRMPVILEEKDILAWLNDPALSPMLLTRTPPTLIKQEVS